MKYIKGQSGNPKGRTVETEQQKRIAADLLSPLVKTAVETIKAHLEKVDDVDGQRWAVGLIMSYVFGKPFQGVEISGKDGKEITVNINLNPNDNS